MVEVYCESCGYTDEYDSDNPDYMYHKCKKCGALLTVEDE